MTLKEQVPSRCWYYLLDFNDRDNWCTITKKFNEHKLNELTISEFWKLFDIATGIDKEAAKNQINS